MNVNKLFRIKDWLITKLLFNFSFVLAVFYFTKPSFIFFLGTIALIIIYIMSIGAFGYFINDWFDSKADSLSGKSNEVSKLGFSIKMIFMFLLLSIGVVPFVFFLPEVRVYIYLLVVQVVLLLLYSVPPIKLKQNIFGLFADSLFSYVLPALICFYITFRNFNITFLKNPIAIALIVWLFFIGIRSILIHQQKDYGNDLQSMIKTFTIRFGKEKALFLTKLVMSGEVISFMVLIFVLPSKLGISVAFSVALYLIIECLINYKLFRFFNNYFETATKLNVFYNYYLFSGIALWMSIQISYSYIFIVLIFLIIRLRNEIYQILNKFYHRVILYVYYKGKGAIVRTGRLFRKTNNN